MSARQWTTTGDLWETGDNDLGAYVYVPGRLRGQCAVGAWAPGGRTFHEAGIRTMPEAQKIASEWLDRREAEDKQAQKGGTT